MRRPTLGVLLVMIVVLASLALELGRISEHKFH